MSGARILLVGYYGKGNAGDDVLLSVTHALVRHAFPDGDISIVVDGDGGAYVKNMLGNVTILAPGRHGHFDLIVHGGGGVFFDFANYPLQQRMLETLIRLFGFARFVRAEKALRHIAGRPRSSATRRVGLGIGVGTFTAGSRRLRASLPLLADFDALWVRDAASVNNLARFLPAMHARILAGSDLAFLSEHWLPEAIPQKLPATRPRLGIVLRDWPVTRGGLDEAALVNVLAQLANEFELTGFVFDAREDAQWQRLLAPYTHHTWRPETMHLAGFMQHIAAQDVLLTSRAHGAICAACLGVPSVIVPIEPKLEQVAAMLPHATRTVAAHAPGDWASAVHAARAIPASAVREDVARNRAASLAALDALQLGAL